jgi:hypothetical protein
MISISKYLDEFLERIYCSNPPRSPPMAECRVYSKNMITRPMGFVGSISKIMRESIEIHIVVDGGGSRSRLGFCCLPNHQRIS